MQHRQKRTGQEPQDSGYPKHAKHTQDEYMMFGTRQSRATRATSVPSTQSSQIMFRPRIQTSVPRFGGVPTHGQAPIFVEGLHNSAPREGNFVKLQCKVIGEPMPLVSWFKDNCPLPRSNAYRIEQMGETHYVIFYDIFIEDSGEYVCFAENPLGTAQTSCRMDVELPILEGDQLTLECHFTGAPIPHISWYRNGQFLQSTPDFQIVQEGEIGRLKIHEAFQEDCGVYQAIATNPLGSAQTGTVLKVGPSEFRVGYSRTRNTVVSPLSHRVENAPEFVRVFKDTYIDSDGVEYVRFDCTVTGTPEPLVTWYFDGQKIPFENPRFEQVQGVMPGEHSLVIYQPGPDTLGLYEAIAENTFGRVTCSALLGPRTISPSISPAHSHMSLTQYTRTTSLPRHYTSRHVVYTPPMTPMPSRPSRYSSYARMQPMYLQRTFVREASAPPIRRYLSSKTLASTTSRRRHSPVQVNFRLTPQMSRSEYVSSPAPSSRRNSYSHLESMERYRLMESIPKYRSHYEHTLTSQAKLIPGYTSQEEHEHAMHIVPMISQFQTTLERSVPSRPDLVAGYSSEEEIEQRMHVVPMVRQYTSSMEREVASRPRTRPAYETRLDRARPISVTPMVREFRSEFTREMSARPDLVSVYHSEQEFETRMDVVPMVRQHKQEIVHDVFARPDTMPAFESSARFINERHFEMSNFKPIDIVVDMPAPPQFIEPLKNIMTSEGSQVVIDGLVTGKPEPKISWYRHGRELQESPDFQLEYRDKRVKLTISEALADDVGPYTCTAENVAGSAESTAYLQLKMQLVPPKFEIGLHSESIVQGQTINMVVKVSGHPPPTVTWTRNGNEIISSPDFILESYGDGIYALTIPDVSLYNTGRFSIIAENEAGEAITTGIISVVDRHHMEPLYETKRSESHVAVRSNLPRPPVPEGPVFTHCLHRDAHCIAGDQVVLSVEATGNPLPHLSWYRNGVPILDGPDCYQRQMGPPLRNPTDLQPSPVAMSGELIIEAILPDDRGEYLCVAENPYGKAETSCVFQISPQTVLVEVPLEKGRRPIILKAPVTEVTIEERSSLILEALVDGDPKPAVSWFRSGKEILPDSRHHINYQPNSGTVQFIIEPTDFHDTGDYRMVASNSLGQATHDMHIDIIVAP
ncbi:hypothetical protein Ciccas_006550 [Cichlidogyrus casuarinus]|uniref:Ig-like domain-containing protein n=1 Tax=Cichlidogyrus casuarinus TaxID=1844966 RepID=A0ABD2Q5W2_9PLAT